MNDIGKVNQITLTTEAGAYQPEKEREYQYVLKATDSDIIAAHDTKTFRTGVSCELPEYTFVILTPVAELKKYGIITTGVISGEYKGPITVSLMNLSDAPFMIFSGDPIARITVGSAARSQQ